MCEDIADLFDEGLELEKQTFTLKKKHITLNIESVHNENQHIAAATSTILWGGAQALSEILASHIRYLKNAKVLELGFLLRIFHFILY